MHRLERRRATHLVVLIASLGALAVIQNIIAAVYTPNILQFPLPGQRDVVSLGSVRLTYAQVLTVVVSLAAYAGHDAVRPSHASWASASAPWRPIRSWPRSRGCSRRTVYVYRDRHRLGGGVPAGRAGAARSRACSPMAASRRC